VCEIQTQLAISEALNFGSKESRREAETLCADVSRMLNALMRTLKK